MTQAWEWKAGFTGGLVMSVISLNYTDLLQTMICAAAGTVVSYGITFLLRKLSRTGNKAK